jgi:ABC-2 type transport system ATP-binding protein
MDSNKEVKVEVKNLNKTFGTLKAVEDVSFNLTSGEVHGFIGPNGAGKTTTMRIMATLENPDSGDVFVNNTSVLSFPDRVRPDIGFMPDYLDTCKAMLVHEYLDFYARAYRLTSTYRRKRLYNVIEFTDLSNMLDKPVDGLSKGMKQRLSLARVLINDPDLLILDEPAAGLDPRARVELRGLCRKLADRGKAVLISSHILSELSEICDSVTIIEKGRIHTSNQVKSILTEIDSGTRVAVRLNNGKEENSAEIKRLVKYLAETNGITDVTEEFNGALFSYSGAERFRVDLLKKLVAENFEVMDFHAASSDLEDVFMSITEGEVN